MPRIRTLTMFTLLTIMVTALAACGGAPAPQSSGSATAAPAASGGATTVQTAPTVGALTTGTAPTNAPAPTAALAPTAAAAPSAMATASSAPLTDTNPAKPDDKTQGRLRMSNCIYHSPNVDVFVNGKVAVNGGRPQINMAFSTSTYLYLEPGSYSVALVPTGKGMDQALLGPVDVSIAAGHRYTVVAMGQLSDTSHKALVIDETAAFQAIGASPTDSVQVTVNNLKGVPALDWFLGGKARVSNVPYGGFKAAIWPVGLRDDVVTVSGAPNKVLHTEGDIRFAGPGRDEFLCWGGSYPGSIPADYDASGAVPTSELNVLDFLQLLTDASAKNGGKSSFATLLAAIKTAGLTDMLTNGGPHLVLAPSDEAFAALPKDKLDALLADPKALTDLLRGHIVEGYFPAGTLSSAPGVSGFDRTVTNMRGEQLRFQGGGEPLIINGTIAGFTESFYVANGTRVILIGEVLLPDSK